MLFRSLESYVPKKLWSRYLSLHFSPVTFINEASGVDGIHFVEVTCRRSTKLRTIGRLSGSMFREKNGAKSSKRKTRRIRNRFERDCLSCAQALRWPSLKIFWRKCVRPRRLRDSLLSIFSRLANRDGSFHLSFR